MGAGKGGRLSARQPAGHLLNGICPVGEKNKVPENLVGGSPWTGSLGGSPWTVSLGGRGQRERTEWCAMEREGFFERTYELVRQIPRGRVASYGQIAAMLGQPRKARFVGFAMHASPGQAAGVPCHRVVFKDGSLAAGYAFGGPSVQRQLLEEEGVVFLPDGRVDMSTCRWEA